MAHRGAPFGNQNRLKHGRFTLAGRARASAAQISLALERLCDRVLDMELAAFGDVPNTSLARSVRKVTAGQKAIGCKGVRKRGDKQSSL